MNTRSLLGALAAVAAFLLTPSPGYAIDRSQCFQYGGATVCHMPVIGRWTHRVCGEVGAFTNYQIAECLAQGGSWSFGACVGLPPVELRRPIVEADIVPLAKDVFANFQGPLCDGPNSVAYTWGVPITSSFCSTAGSGPVMEQGYEKHNNTNHFLVSGKKLNGGVCAATDTTLNFSASRDRLVQCPSHGDSSYVFTSGATPGLCSAGWTKPIFPWQCNDCNDKSPNPTVGNPIDPITGVKRQVEMDYAASGPQALKFERVYHSRVYVLDGNHWRHNYSARIEYQTFGTHPVAFAHRAGGRSYPFREIGGVITPYAVMNDSLTKLTDGSGALTGWEYRQASDESVETYDAAGRLLTITSRAGLTTTLEYSTVSTPPSIAKEPGLLIKVTDPFGRELNFTYDAIARMVTMQNPAGQLYAYTYNSNHMLTSVTYPDAKTRTYVYGEHVAPASPFMLTGIVDENNSRFATYYYNNEKMASGTKTGENLGAGIDYSNWPNSVVVRDARGTTRTYTYQSMGGIYLNTGITQPGASGGTASSAILYMPNNNIWMRRDFNGNRTNYNSYDSRNLETSRTEGLTSAGAITPATRVIETDWHATFRLPTQIREKNSAFTLLRQTDMTYDGSGNLLTRSVTDGASTRTWTYTYNGNGSVLSIDGPRTDVSDVTSYTYYANNASCPGASTTGCRGQVETITNAAGHVTTIAEYNAHGQPLTIVDTNNVTTSLSYDLRQRLIARSVGGEMTDYEFDSAGLLKKVLLPDGSFLSYTYDAGHRLTRIDDNAGNRIAYTLDPMGNRVAEDVLDTGGALKRTLSRAYEALNRLSLEIHP